MKRARRALVALSLAVVAALAGCFGVPIDTPAPSEDEVMNLVSLACPNEGWEVVHVEETREEPQQITYTLRSTERALTFTAVSEITEPSYSLWAIPPKPRITCDYPEVVRDIYANEVRELLSKRAGEAREGELYAPERTLQIYVCNYEQLEEAVGLLAEADLLFEAELAYNDQQWIRECAASDVSVRWYNGIFDEEHPYTVSDQGNREVKYASKKDITDGIIKKYHPELLEPAAPPNDESFSGGQNQQMTEHHQPASIKKNDEKDKNGGTALQTVPKNRRTPLPQPPKNTEVTSDGQA